MEHDLKLWGNDRLTSFLDRAHTNNLAFFEADSAHSGLLVNVDQAFHDAIGALPLISERESDEELTSRMFLLMAHGSYLAGVRTATSGQLSEAYALLRACLERGIYAYHLRANREAFDAWWGRHYDDVARKRSKKLLKITDMFAGLEAANAKTAALVKSLYDDAIDLGAHPNVLDATSNVATWEEGEEPLFGRKYLHYDSQEARACVAKCAAVGIASLMTFRLLFNAHFMSSGVAARLADLQSAATDLLERGVEPSTSEPAG
jgi:hypothetical protein